LGYPLSVKTKRDFLFKSAKIQHLVFSRLELNGYVQSCLRDCQTALIEIGSESGSYALFGLLLVRGQLVNFYRYDALAIRLPPSEWFDFVGPTLPVFGVRTLAFTPQTLRLVKILLEQYCPGRTQVLSSGALDTAVRIWGKSIGPVLLHMSWPSADGLALLPGGGISPRHTLFLAGDQVFHSAGSMAALYGWKEADCQLRVYSSLAAGAAWDEYFLHHVFVWQVGHLLQRLEELSGRMLVNTIVREMNFAALAHDWNITISARSVTDQAMFFSPTQAGQVYQRLFEILQHHAELALGPDLFTMLLREVQMRLYAPYRVVYERYATLIKEQSPA
jgi:hypothetical protein